MSVQKGNLSVCFLHATTFEMWPFRANALWMHWHRLGLLTIKVPVDVLVWFDSLVKFWNTYSSNWWIFHYSDGRIRQAFSPRDESNLLVFSSVHLFSTFAIFLQCSNHQTLDKACLALQNWRAQVVSAAISASTLHECRTFRPRTFRPRTFRPGHFGHGRFGHWKCQRWTFRPNYKFWVGVCACINVWCIS